MAHLSLRLVVLRFRGSRWHNFVALIEVPLRFCASSTVPSFSFPKLEAFSFPKFVAFSLPELEALGFFLPNQENTQDISMSNLLIRKQYITVPSFL